MLQFKEKDKLFFIADPHFYHDSIIDYCSRPFTESYEKDDTGASIATRLENMNYKLIKNWNDTIPKNGIVFIAGDIVFTSKVDVIKELLSKLNGEKYLIFGNHDYQNRLDRDIIKDMFLGTYDLLDIKVEDNEVDDGYQWINLCHYPLESWSKKARGSWMLHGHVHSGPLSTSEDKNLRFMPNRYDVGVDNNNFYPVSYQQLKTIITKQNLKGK